MNRPPSHASPLIPILFFAILTGGVYLVADFIFGDDGEGATVVRQALRTVDEARRVVRRLAEPGGDGTGTPQKPPVQPTPDSRPLAAEPLTLVSFADPEPRVSIRHSPGVRAAVAVDRSTVAPAAVVTVDSFGDGRQGYVSLTVDLPAHPDLSGYTALIYSLSLAGADRFGVGLLEGTGRMTYRWDRRGVKAPDDGLTERTLLFTDMSYWSYTEAGGYAQGASWRPPTTVGQFRIYLRQKWITRFPVTIRLTGVAAR
jgi:hypothetical protein